MTPTPLRALLASILALTAFVSASARPDSLRLYWDADMMAVFDNREGSPDITHSKTFFETRLAPEIGASFSSSSARHRLAGGIVWLQPLGSEWEGYRLSPTLYYRYEGVSGIAASIGMFGRGQLIAPLPDYIVSDSVYYSQRNLRGALLQYRSAKGYAEIFVDWRGMQSRERREAFSIIGQGRWQRGKIIAGGAAMLNHLARSAGDAPGQHVIDNLLANPYIGLDWRRVSGSSPRRLTGMVTIGLLTSLSRDRGDGRWLPRAAFRLEGEASYRCFVAKNTLTAGRPIFPLYGRFGSLLHEGEPYYAAKWYDRLSIGANLISSAHVLLRATLDFHFAPSDVSAYQRLMLQVNIGSNPRRPRLRL